MYMQNLKEKDYFIITRRLMLVPVRELLRNFLIHIYHSDHTQMFRSDMKIMILLKIQRKTKNNV